MKRPTFEPVEKTQSVSALILDKEGCITAGLLPLFPSHAQTVVVGSQRSADIHFGNTMPSIPDSYYSHIFIVYNGEKDVLHLIPQFLEKARADESKIFFILDLFFADPSFLQELTYSYRNAYVFVTGDSFGKTILLDADKTIHRFFHEANTKGTIHVSGDGLTHTFPVLFNDAMDAIVVEAFIRKTAKISYVFPKHAPTELSLARIFQTINPFLRIDFVDATTHSSERAENEQRARHITASGIYLLQSNYPLLKKIKETELLSEDNVVEKPQVKSTSLTRLRPAFVGQRKKKPFSPFPYVIFFLALLLFMPLLVTLFLAGLGAGGLWLTKQSLLSGELPKAAQSAAFANTFFGLSKTTGAVVSLEAGMLGMGKNGETFLHMLTLGEEGSYGLENVISAARTYQIIFQKTSTNPKEDFITASNKLKKAVTIFQKIQAQDTIPGFSDIDDVVTLVAATIDSYPTLFGMDGEKTYLVLFQNNAELRPSGGFIGSYGLLTVNKGSVSDFQIHDVYDADGQLTAHVEPAYPLRRYMGIVHQYLRDSNYSPDFPTAASTSANMLYLETGETVSGVIGVDVSFVKTLVGALGSIYVPDYKETVNEENFYMLTQTHAEKDFFPGSTQKKDFLRSLFSAIQLKLSDQKSPPYVSLSQAVARAISEKHMLFAFPDPSIQHLFSVNNLSSSLLDSREVKTQQYNDFLGLSETNIGANKANAFVYRKVDQRITLDETGRIKNTVTVRYKNESSDWPGGDYKNYIRIITPKGPVLTDITIDGQKQSITPAITDYLLYERPDYTSPPGLEVETSEEVNKTLFGFLVITPKGKFKTISASYVSPTVLDMGQQVVAYDLWYFKQNGTDAYSYSFIFSYPENFKAFRVSEDLRVIGDSVVLEENIATDQKIHIELSKK